MMADEDLVAEHVAETLRDLVTVLEAMGLPRGAILRDATQPAISCGAGSPASRA